MELFIKKNPLAPDETKIQCLGIPGIESPLLNSQFSNEKQRVLYSPYYQASSSEIPVSFEVAGPRKKIFFEPAKVKAAIVTCGGICPGLNNVIRAIVLGLYNSYGVRSIFGIQYGMQGLSPDYGHPLIDLSPETVANIHKQGGTILGTSRGEQSIDEAVNTLESLDLSMLFVLGGDGTFRAAQKIAEEVQNRKLKIAVIGVPKTIDNDISYVYHSFGFDTAVEEAAKAIQSAHIEAKSSPNGIGLVKLMGRHSGFIAATAALAQRDVNFVLVPEVDFDLDGRFGFLEAVRNQVVQNEYAVIVVAEGAGQKYFETDSVEKDASGNLRLHDIGYFLKQTIKNHFDENKIEVNIKYIDPSYLIRSVPANKSDALFCERLGQNAVHAAMAGKTSMLVTQWQFVFCHNPLHLATRQRKQIHPGGALWNSVLETTRQSNFHSS
ncbi:MAG: ATP-dependent 6-phosphofructokinase [SAR324 cluster bacterium]|nr:ATP-dependent 6-phosphofructokinase [SAR324 cluster bacterium]